MRIFSFILVSLFLGGLVVLPFVMASFFSGFLIKLAIILGFYSTILSFCFLCIEVDHKRYQELISKND